jgi:alpha-L-arabinofuranosidase
MVNVLQAMILTRGPAMILTPTYHAFEMYVPFQDATRLPVTLKDVPEYAHAGFSLPAVSASAALGTDGRLHVGLVNVDPNDAIDVVVDVDNWAVTSAEARILTASTIDARNTFDAPDAVGPRRFDGIEIDDGALKLTLPAKSIVVIASQRPRRTRVR